MKFKSALLLVALVSLSYPMVALAIDCNNLEQEICKDGSFNDGTGTVTLPSNSKDKITEFILNNQADLEKELLNDLKDSDSELFKKASGIFKTQDRSVLVQKMIEWFGISQKNKIEKITSLAESQGYSVDDLSDLLTEPDFTEAFIHLENKAQKKIEKSENLNTAKTKVFPRVKKTLLKRIDNLPISEKDREEFRKAIKEIEFGGADCGGGLAVVYEPSAYIGNKKFNVCGGLLQDGLFTEYTLAFTLAHELSHSVDPCNYSLRVLEDRRSKQVSYPLPDLIACLSDEKSLGLKVNNKGDASVPEDGDDCIMTRIGEATADTFAADVLADYMDQYAENLSPAQKIVAVENAGRIFCTDRNYKAADRDLPRDPNKPHPTDDVRLNRILAQQPQLRAILGCAKKEEHKYCGSNSVQRLSRKEEAGVK
jgi:hypothetical protein